MKYKYLKLFFVYFFLINFHTFAKSNTSKITKINSPTQIEISNIGPISLLGVIETTNTEVNQKAMEYLNAFYFNEPVETLMPELAQQANEYPSYIVSTKDKIINEDLLLLGYVQLDPMLNSPYKENYLRLENHAKTNQLGLWKTQKTGLYESDRTKPVISRTVVSKKTIAAHPVIGEKLTQLFHEPKCKDLKHKKIEELEPFGYPTEALQKHYKPCPKCIHF